MAVTNHERVGKALNMLKDGLGPFIEREFTSTYKDRANKQAIRFMGEARSDTQESLTEWDVAALLRLMWESWNDVFRLTLGHAERSLVSELRSHRNQWAHQKAFSGDDAYRVLDSAGRLLSAVSAPQTAQIDTMKSELLRLRFDEQARAEKRKNAGVAIASGAAPTLKPWREVATPHKDVASGRYQQAEFAADLWQVHLGEGTDEYRDPVEFFRRTYLTASLKRMLVGSVMRLSGTGGDPVIQLQTNFGGGKTHSMLAGYHLFSGVPPQELVGIDEVMQEAEIDSLPDVRRVVLVGTKISPGNPSTKPDGTVVRTLWGELAWQLGGKEAYARIQADDENATNPADVLRELLVEYGPCLILIDEWVAYARQLHEQSDLPAGSFETQFTFAQTLTESVKLAKNSLLIISLPASDTGVSPHAQADDVEVGGQRGREALERLRNAVGRIDSPWRLATVDEGFEIVRRRLFEPMSDPNQYKDRDVVVRAFADVYRTQYQEFPPECRGSDYEKRMKAAYPIHPEVFDRLYNDWSTLARFQRTRGVLRLMAAVIHSLWEKGDRSPLILPANISIDDPRVQFELTRYLSDNWVPVIEKDVDGPHSLPLNLDRDIPNLGKFSACRRVARSIYLGSAPLTHAAHRGLEDRSVKLGCVMPGESPSIFVDALRRLAGAATYLYQDGPRYWYSTQPTVIKLAEDRAEQLKRDSDQVIHELDGRLRKDLAEKGDFTRIHPMPQSGQDVPDDRDTRLVVLSADHPHTKDANSQALAVAKSILELRGNTPRLYQNTLIFLAADKTRLQDLDEAARKYLAWQSILAEKEILDLAPQQVKQAETQLEAADGAVTARIPETYQWLLVPIQETPQAAVSWEAIRLAGQDALAVRACKKLRNDELLVTSLGGSRLQMELDRVPLWRGDHVSVKQLAEDFARYFYLPRLTDSSILLRAITDGVSMLTWEQDGFALAESFDDAEARYRGLHCMESITLNDAESTWLVVRAEVARQQRNAELARLKDEESRVKEEPDEGLKDDTGGGTGGSGGEPKPPEPEPRAAQPKRFHGTIELNATRVGRDAGRVAEEVISHLTGLVGAKVKITLEIEAEVPSGVPDQVVRIVTENSRTLKFTTQGFEKE